MRVFNRLVQSAHKRSAFLIAGEAIKILKQ